MRWSNFRFVSRSLSNRKLLNTQRGYIIFIMIKIYITSGACVAKFHLQNFNGDIYHFNNWCFLLHVLVEYNVNYLESFLWRKSLKLLCWWPPSSRHNLPLTGPQTNKRKYYNIKNKLVRFLFDLYYNQTSELCHCAKLIF